MQAIPPVEVPLAPGIMVRRLLPRRGRRMVGPWCFLDVFGPLEFGSGKPMDVPPHPHTGLQTVTWLLEGEVLHKDSLDSEALGVPGTLNLMTSGRGIAHSEETPERNSGRLHGVQLWTALPESHRQGEPSFEHHPQRPVLDLEGGARATVIMGALAGTEAAARVFSPLVAAEVVLPRGARAAVPLEPGFEHALLPLAGRCQLDGQALVTDTLYYLEPGTASPALAAAEDARVLLIGGAPFGEAIVMWWNFVERTSAEVAAAREDWQAGRRFGEVRRYAGERLQAPRFVARPVPPNPAS